MKYLELYLLSCGVGDKCLPILVHSLPYYTTAQEIYSGYSYKGESFKMSNQCNVD